MCRAMAAALQNQEEEPEKPLREQFAAILRSIQWSYAVFWSLSSRQPGVLEWKDGYYNGDIKTRKTTHTTELKADQMGLQRSEQLRELYLSLSAGDNNQQAKRPSASLSPEDLTDSEWYYLVCMSFTFGPGQGLPGRTLASGHHNWICNVRVADSKTFSRSLLAKSASVQTVICFPFMDGVLELGTTELVLEDPNLIQQLTTTFWEFPNTVCSEQSISSSQKVEEDEDQLPLDTDHEIPNSKTLENHNSVADSQTQMEGGQKAFQLTVPSYGPSKDMDDAIEGQVDELDGNSSDELTDSPDYSSNECSPNHHIDDSLMIDGVNGASQVQSWQFMDDEFSNGLHVSLNSSDCRSQSFAHPKRFLSSKKGERPNGLLLHGLQECDDSNPDLLDLVNDDPHYTKILTAIFRNPRPQIAVPCFLNGSRSFSFRFWKKSLYAPKTYTGTPQKTLKKVLFDVARMHNSSPIDLDEENGIRTRVWKSEGDDIGLSHVLSERRRREKLKLKFLDLRSLIPTISKVDKASILGDTIEYLKELERRVEELESCRELTEYETRARKKHPDISERTSDNYGNNGFANGRKSSLNKRKACDMDEPDAEHHWILSKDGLADVSVTVLDKEVLIEMHCQWRECLLLEIVDAISNLHLDAHSVQSSTADGILLVTLKSKFRGTVTASPGMIKQALYKVVGKC